MKRSFLLILIFVYLSPASFAQKDFEALHNGANDLFESGKYAEAITGFDKAIKAAKKGNSSLFLCYLNRGISKSRTGDYWGAKADLDNCIKLNPEYPDSYLFRGILSILLSNGNAAINDLNRTSELDSLNYHAHMYKADLYEDFKDFENAIESYGDALKLKPDLVSAYKKRAAIYFSLKRYNEAIKDYSSLIEMDKESGDMYFMRGLCKSLISEEDNLGACEDLLRAKNLGTKINLPGINKYCKVNDLEN